MIEVKHLKKYFYTNHQSLFRKNVVKAVDDISFSVEPGKVLGIMGQSGSGKSTTAKLIGKLLSPDDGEILFRGTDIAKMENTEFRRKVQTVFQNTSLIFDPKSVVGEILETPLKLYGTGKERNREREVYRLLDIVGLDRSFARRFPHQLSGGQLQRVVIARAISVSPELIICDEPVSNLDVSVQAQIINLLTDIQMEYRMTCVFISHDERVVRYFADDIIRMRDGKIVRENTESMN